MVRLFGVTKRYTTGGEPFDALADVSFAVERGEFVALLGPSGSGKSTLLHLIGGLDRPTEGIVEVDGRDLASMREPEIARYRSERVGFIFQSFNLLPNASALENAMLPRMYGGRRRTRRARAAQLLKALGMGDKLANRPTQLSGGEQQRVAIARALINQPDLILADEPTGNLDSRTGAHVIEILSWLNGRGRTVVIVTHDAAIAERAHRVVSLQDGRIVAV